MLCVLKFYVVKWFFGGASLLGKDSEEVHIPKPKPPVPIGHCTILTDSKGRLLLNIQKVMIFHLDIYSH